MGDTSNKFLKAGITGIGSNVRENIKFVEFRDIVTEAVSSLGGEISCCIPSGARNSHHLAFVEMGGSPNAILGNIVYPVLGFSPQKNLVRFWDERFMDCPSLANWFSVHSRFTALDSGLLNQKVGRRDIKGLGEDEVKQVKIHRAAICGDIIFNGWEGKPKKSKSEIKQEWEDAVPPKVAQQEAKKAFEKERYTKELTARLKKELLLEWREWQNEIGKDLSAVIGPFEAKLDQVCELGKVYPIRSESAFAVLMYVSPSMGRLVVEWFKMKSDDTLPYATDRLLEDGAKKDILLEWRQWQEEIGMDLSSVIDPAQKELDQACGIEGLIKVRHQTTFGVLMLAFPTMGVLIVERLKHDPGDLSQSVI